MPMPMVRVHGAGDVRLDTVEPPQVNEGDVLVRVSLCGICGSDLGYIAMGGLGMTQPMPLGHELVGTVAEVGGQITHVQPGDRVVVNPMANSNSIGNGGPEGGFAPYLLVRNAGGEPGAILKVPANLSDRQAALVEPLSVALHGCHRGRVVPGDKVTIMGAGPIGLCTLVCLRYLGIDQVVVVDVSAFRLEAAASLGATTFLAGEADLGKFLIEQHGASDLMGMPVPATDLFIEATGSREVFETLLNTAGGGARIVVLGVHKEPVTVDLTNLLMRELSVAGSMAYPEEFPAVLDMLSSGRAIVEPLVTHQFPLSSFEHALSQARDGNSAIKVLVDCQS